MALIPTDGNVSGQIEVEQIKSAAEIENDAALKLVVQDSDKADAYIQEKMWATRWKEIDILYQSPRPISSWENTNVPEANITSFLVAKHVNTIVPQLVEGLLADDPPFLLRPRPGTGQNVVRAKTAVAVEQLDEMKFSSEVEDGLFYTALFGTAIYKWGWQNCKEKQPRYVRKAKPTKIATNFGDITVHTKDSDEFEVHEVEKDTDRPEFEHVPLQHVKVDPSLRFPDIRKANWVIHDRYLNFYDLQKLRDEEQDYDLPGDETLKSWFEPPKEQAKMGGPAESYSSGVNVTAHANPRQMQSSGDPLLAPLLVQERWDAHKRIVVVQKKHVICNEANPFGCIPFYSSHWWRIPDSFYSLGIGMLIGQDQRVTQGVRNAILNILAMAAMPTYVRSEAANVPTQNIRMRRGGIITVQGPVREAFGLLELPQVPQGLWQALQNSSSESESTSGANELLVQAAPGQGGKTSMTRTATGAGAYQNASLTRMQGPISRFIENVFEPWLYQMDELNRERLPMTTLRDILGESLGSDFSVDEEAFLNAKLEYEILAGARLAVRSRMEKMLPLMSQIFENAQILKQLQETGYTVDVMELMSMFYDISGWTNKRDLIRPLNQQEKAFMQQQNQQAAKAQTQMQVDNNKAQLKSQQNDQQNEAKATNQVERIVLEHALQAGMGLDGAVQ